MPLTVKNCLQVLALVFLAATINHAAVPVWIDTDPSVQRGGHEVDDGLALIQAFHSPELTVRGVSVVFGNAPLETALPIGRRLVRDFGPDGLQVYAGASARNELGQETDASRALAIALMREKLTILALGPVTNIATVLRIHPELSQRVDRVVAVAGRRPGQKFVTGGAAKPFRDFNFEMDPAAFQVLLDSGVPLVLAPWEISSKVWIRTADLEQIKSSGSDVAWVVDAATDWLNFWKQGFRVDGFNPFDTLAVGYIASPGRFTCEKLPVRIVNLPDDTASSNETSVPAKPYLIAARERDSRHSATYCFEPPAGFREDLVHRLSQQKRPVDATTGDPSLDHSAWNAALKQYVTADSSVNYRALKESGLAELEKYLQTLAAPWPPAMTAADRKAALINAYNSLTVRWIVTNYPVESIWRTHHPFTEQRHALNGRKVSLDWIESQLRELGDPRIHAALVCASRSCPPLRREAYDAARIDEQLDDNTRLWLMNTQLNEFFPERRLADVSMIFKWYAGDFRRDGSTAAKFLARFGPPAKAAFLLEPNPTIEYKTYRWGLNDASSLGSGYSQAQFRWDAIRNKVF